MNKQQYSDFLDDPCKFLNNGSVTRLRLDSGLKVVKAPATSRTVQYPGSVPLRYQQAKASVQRISVRHSDTGIPPTSAVWVDTRDPSQEFQNDNAYYLNWGPDSAYAIELGLEAQLFFTAELTGCGIIVLTGGGKTIVVHHNIQVAAPDPTLFQKVFESAAKKQARETAFVGLQRTDSLFVLLDHIVKENPNLTAGQLLSVQHYGGNSQFFGIKRGGRWRFYVNRPVGEAYQTHEIRS